VTEPSARAAADFQLALHHRRAGQAWPAERLLRRVVATAPSHRDALNELHLIAVGARQYDRAERLLCAAIRVGGIDGDMLFNLGVLRQRQDRPADAVAAYRGALAWQPADLEAWTNLGEALRHAAAGSGAAAVDAAARALRLEPGPADRHFNLGVALAEAGRPHDAVAAYDAALARAPDHVDARWNRACLQLLTGDFGRGWAGYEVRWRRSGAPVRRLGPPLWRGEPLTGRTILLHHEQGFGDTLQFCRFVPEVARRADPAAILLEVPRELAGLLRDSLAGPGVDVVEAGAVLPRFDAHCPLLSLPLALGTELATIPAAVPYLRAIAERVAAWSARLGPPDGTVRVGLVWAGSASLGQADDHRLDRLRSVRLGALAPLAAIPGVRLYSLQKGPPAGELAAFAGALPVVDRSPDLTDFAETAACIAQLDLVISVDTAVAHLAGALAKPVWLLSRFNGCWRWLTGRADSPWYPTLRLFRQAAPHDWSGVVAHVADELAALAAGDRTRLMPPIRDKRLAPPHGLG